jgi:hypothetical protein
MIFLQEIPSLLWLRDAHGPPPALLFSCQSGVGRTNLGMVLGTLVLFHHGGTTLQPEWVAWAPANQWSVGTRKEVDGAAQIIGTHSGVWSQSCESGIWGSFSGLSQVFWVS